MPLFSYVCENCRKSCELLVRASDTPACPHCGKSTLVKQASAVAPPVMAGGGPVSNLPENCQSCCSRRDGTCPKF